MNGGHEAFHYAELVVDDLGQRSQAVGGAGSVGNDLHVLGVGVEVNAANEGGGFLILRRGGDDYLLGARLDVSGSLFGGAEYAGGFHNVFRANGTPRNLGGVLLSKYADRLAVYDELAVFGFEVALELAVHGVVLRHVNHVVQINEGIVDANDFKGFRLRYSRAEH